MCEYKLLVSSIYFGNTPAQAIRSCGPCYITVWGALHFRQKLGGFSRNEGPAYITPDGYIAYFIDGQHHRTTGPAIIHRDGSKEYKVHDKHLTQLEFFLKYGGM